MNKIKNVINVTNCARKQLSNIMNNHKYILFHVEGGGCNGLKYTLEPNNDEPKKIDEIVILDDLKINVCGKSLLYLLGTNIDWKEDEDFCWCYADCTDSHWSICVDDYQLEERDRDFP